MQRVVWDQENDRTFLVQLNGSIRTVSGHVGAVLSRFHSEHDAQEQAGLTMPRTLAALRGLGLGDPSDWVFQAVPRSPHLKRLQIEVALKCNLSCSYCYSTSGPLRTESLSPEQVRAIIEDANRMGVLSIDFTGGEFLMAPDWDGHIRLARSYGMAVTVHTNGTLIRNSVAPLLSELGVASVQVSLDSHLAEVHDAARGHRGALARSFAGIDSLLQNGVKTRISLMAHQDNIHSLGDTITELTTRFRGVAINVDRVVRTGGAVSADNGLTAGEFWDFLRPYIAGNVRAGRICESPGIEDFEPDCGVAYSYVYVTANGEYAACPTMTSRESPEFRGPLVRDHGLEAAWYDSEFFQSFRYTNCENVRQCPAGTVCGGGCRSNAYVESGSVTAPDTFACNLMKNETAVFIDFPKRYSEGRFGVVTAAGQGK